MQTANKHYPLPNKNHDVLEDLARINEAFTAIDSDVTLAENSVSQLQEAVSNLDAKSLTIPKNLDIDTEIQHIKVNNYLVTNKDGTGFTTTEGGGNEGGILGQCLAKTSDENYKTAWGNFWEISKNGDEVHILSDEEKAADQMPKSGLVNKQTKSDVFSDSNDSFIFKDSIEQITETPELATRLNYGLVKIGSGIDVDDGVISVSQYKNATADEFGLVKVGSGINVNDGIISVSEIQPASYSAFGVVKLSDDFEIGINGELKVAKKTGGEPIIYKLAKMKIVNNGVIELEENVAIYRAFINEDMQFSFNMNFVPKADFSFILEIISDGEHLVGFDDQLKNSDISGINRGTTRIKFTKLLGADFWNASVDILEAPEPTLLTPNNGDSIKSDLILSSNGSSWDPYSMMGTDIGNIAFYNTPREVYFDFAKSVVVDYVYFYDSNNANLSLFEFLGSNDKVNWTRLIYRSGSVIGRKNVATERKGAFHYFKLRFSNEGNIRGIQLYGAMIANNDSELILLTPSMGSNSVAGITISCSNLKANTLRDVTAPSANSCIELDKGTFSDAWIQYEFTQPQVANFLDMASQQDSTYRTARWFKLLASNDGNAWDLLLERQYQEDWKQCETRYFEFENTTAYKYYRLICSYTSDGALLWRISRFRLFRRESGTSSFINSLPTLIAASQDGYEVSANSVADSGHAIINVFDGNADTKWETASGDHLNSWIKIKLPNATAINAAYLQARNDSYYYQAPSAFKIQASDDGTSWTDLSYNAASWIQKEGKIFYWQNETPYLYYRLLIESVQSGSNAGLAEFALGRKSKTYRRYLTQYNYLTPAMTSNSQNGFIASASSEYSGGEGAWRAFDRSSAQWTTVNGTNKNVELKMKLPAAASCDLISITGSNGPGRCPSTFYVQGSSDNAAWVNLISQTTPLTWGSSETKTWEISNPTPFLYYRLYVLTNNGDGFLSVQEFSLINKTIVQEY